MCVLCVPMREIIIGITHIITYFNNDKYKYIHRNQEQSARHTHTHHTRTHLRSNHHHTETHNSIHCLRHTALRQLHTHKYTRVREDRSRKGRHCCCSLGNIAKHKVSPPPPFFPKRSPFVVVSRRNERVVWVCDLITRAETPMRIHITKPNSLECFCGAFAMCSTRSRCLSPACS